jgi:hypothetical protein
MMRKLAVCAVLVGVLLLALPVATQEAEGHIARIIFFGPQPGKTQQLEEKMKEHVQWHAEQNDTWTWNVWQYVSGKATGSYGAGTFGHKWEDFDSAPLPPDVDDADAMARIGPYATPPVISYYQHLAEVSRPPTDEAPAAMLAVIVFQVRYGKAADFSYLLKKFHTAVEKTNWPVNYDWYALVNGGVGPTYVLVLPRPDWASFKPQEKPFPQMLEEAFGRPEADAFLHKLGKVVKSQESSIIRIRPDLSYTPAGN